MNEKEADMARIEHIHLRLEVWALWKTNGGTIGGSSSLALWGADRVDCKGFRALMAGTINDDECQATDSAILALPAPLGETVAMYYLLDSSRTREKLSISASTLSQRIDQAHRILDVALRKAPGPDAARPQSWVDRV